MSTRGSPYWRLIRWLGPWTRDTRSPGAVACRRVKIGAQSGADQPVEALVYAPTDRAAIGSYLFAHGLNPRGPDDERCDRFARVLSHAGFIVMCPRLDALTQMRLDQTAIDQFSSSLEALVALDEHAPGTLPGVFSVSFGSFPALMTAASRRAGHLVGSLVVFGGYADFVATCRYMAGIDPRRAGEPPPDPTCMAGLAINTAAVLFPDVEGHKLAQAWGAFVFRVWGQPGMRERERFSEVAFQLASELPADLTQIFLQGCGIVPGFGARVEQALARMDVAAMDPRAHLHAICCPVHLFHGRGDNVIPYTQMAVLAEGLSNASPQRYLTGLYGHSRGEPGAGALARLPLLLREIRTMAAMVDAVVLGGTRLRRIEASAAFPS